MLKLRKNKKGFTLVELIVVIAIMAILAGTVAGVVVTTQQNAKNSAASSSAKSLADQIVLMLGAPSDWTVTDSVYDGITLPLGEDNEMCYVKQSGSAVTFNETRIIKELKSDENYKDAIVEDNSPKAGTNKYLVTVTTAKIDNTEGVACIRVEFDTLGTSNKYNNVYLISMGNDDQFKVTASKG